MNDRNRPDSEEYISEGEIYIQEFFIKNLIYFEYNKKIDFLKGDTKDFRVADFYIPRYDLYVEFFGLWNISEEQKARYREKKNVYNRNNIACIYLYPENLGIIDYLFHYRAMKELKDRRKSRHLFKLRYDIVDSKSKFAQIFIAVFLGLIIAAVISYRDTPRFLLFIICFYLLFLLPLLGSLYLKYRKLVKKKFHKEHNQYI